MPSPSPRAFGYTPPAQPDFFVRTPVSVVRCRTLTPVQKTVYDVLRSYADASGTAYLGQTRLAAEVGVAERTVRTALHTLVAIGLVTLRRRGQGRTNLYQLPHIPLRGPQAPADRQLLPVLNGNSCRSKPARVAAESDRREGDRVEEDPPLLPPSNSVGEGGGERSSEQTQQIAADAALIVKATGMAPAEAQATAEVAAANEQGPGYVAELVAHIAASPNVQNPAGCLRALVQQGRRRPARGAGGVPPRALRAALHPEHYTAGGKYGHLFQREAQSAKCERPTPNSQPPTPTAPPPTAHLPAPRGPSAFEVAANPRLAGRGNEAWPRGQPLD